MQSCLYEGRVRHRRFGSVRHEFSYRLFSMCLDLAETHTVFARRWLWSTRRPALARFRRQDHFGDPALPLDAAVRDLVAAETGVRPAGAIRLLTHLRYAGYLINPISIYFCYDESDQSVDALVLEVTNTPWGERHCYVLGPEQNCGTIDKPCYRFEKRLHVSPFMEMGLRYELRMAGPAEQLVVHLSAYRDEAKLFDATLALARREITGRRLANVLLRYPLMTAQVAAAIYYQALRLWWKGCSFHTHPAKRPAATNLIETTVP